MSQFLDETDAALDQAAGEQGGIGKRAGLPGIFAIEFIGGLRFAGDGREIGHAGLHAEREFVVEVKFWYRGKSVKDLTEEIAADLTLYLRKDSPYRAVIAAIRDNGAGTEEQAELKRGLKGLSGLFDMVIVNRPSCMNDPATTAPVAKKKAKKAT